MPKGKMNKKTIVKIKKCTFIVKPYQRNEEVCRVQIFNGNPHPIKVLISRIELKVKR